MRKEILRVIEEKKFDEPTEIQDKTIPLILEGKDVIGESYTGSGKTLAFAAGIIEKTRKGEGVQALILTPTRELAEQVSDAIKEFSKFNRVNVLSVYGGVDIKQQIYGLRNADIVVGTPGRILDHLKRGTFDTRRIKILVLDEADRMLDMGFIEDVEIIIKHCPKEKQTLLFSATIPYEIENISKRYMKNATYVAAESIVDPSKLSQIFYFVGNDFKFSLLVHLLKNEKSDLVMVFLNTRRNADSIARNLQRYELHALAVHGGLKQNKRNSIMKDFHLGKRNILVCTDVAARGLDIKGVSHVYNYDIPGSIDEYIHRIGRTARAGMEGKAISLVSQRDAPNFRKIHENSSFKIAQEEVPHIERLNISFNRGRDDRRGNRYGQDRGRNNRYGQGRGQNRFSQNRGFSNKRRRY